MPVVKEFMEFLKKYNAIALAVAFIIGTAATKLVSALVADLIMPVVGLLSPGGDWRAIVVPIGDTKFLVGDFLGALVDFIIIALVVFLMAKYVMKEKDPTKGI